jgi:hypothetical protein
LSPVPVEDVAGLGRHLKVLAGDDDGHRQGAVGADDPVLVDDRLQAAAQPQDPQPAADGLADSGWSAPISPVNTSASSQARVACTAARRGRSLTPAGTRHR